MSGTTHELWDYVTRRVPQNEKWIFQNLKGKMEQVLKMKPNSLNREFPGAQVTSLDLPLLRDVLCKQDFYVCEKTDGERYLMILMPMGIKEFGGSILMSRKNEMRVLKGLEMPTEFATEKRTLLAHNMTILDGELVRPKLVNGTQPKLKYLIFDILALNGEKMTGDVRQLDLCNRLRLIRSHVLQPSFHSKYAELRKRWPIDMGMKEMYLKQHTRHVLSMIPHLPHGNDGLVFTPVKEMYVVFLIISHFYVSTTVRRI